MKQLQRQVMCMGLFASMAMCGVANAQAVTVPYRGYDDSTYNNSGYDNSRYDDSAPSYGLSDDYGRNDSRQGNWERGRYGDSSDAGYDYARVLRVDPVFDSSRRSSSARQCYSRDDRYAGSGGYGDDRGYSRNYGRDRGYGDDGYGYPREGNATARNVATIAGGVVGALLGSKIGGGSARYATTAIGSMVGGMAGREIYESSNRYRSDRGRVTVCEPERDGGYYAGNYSGNSDVSQYDVTYEYAGRTRVTRMDHHPGDRIRVRVDAQPD